MHALLLAATCPSLSVSAISVPMPVFASLSTSAFVVSVLMPESLALLFYTLLSASAMFVPVSRSLASPFVLSVSNMSVVLLKLLVPLFVSGVAVLVSALSFPPFVSSVSMAVPGLSALLFVSSI